MQKYETMLVTSATLDQDAAAAIVEKFKKLIEEHGTLESVDDWGKRRMAYPINKEDDGVYTLIRFSSNEEFPKELSRIYSITDGVLRSMVIARTPEEMKAEAAKAEKEAKAEAAAKARAEAAAKAEAAKAAEAEKAEAPAEEEAK